MNQREKSLFLYGKLRHKSKAILYCSLHKCYLDKSQLFVKKFKCEKCKYRQDVEKGI